MVLQPFPPESVRLLGSLFSQRAEVNRRYVMSLKLENLLQNHYQEAGLWSAALRCTTHGDPTTGDFLHWGWESPCCQVRGHFFGHWLSAAARLAASNGDEELRARVTKAVAEVGRCQEENGGEWCLSIPEKYLEWIARGKGCWAPHYTVHKTLMGLLDAHRWTSNAQALAIVVNVARWFHRWTGRFTRAQLDDLLDYETGGMLEAWADLYGITGQREHRELLERYDRPRLFERLLAGEDPLTNRHANTTIPEAHGAARAWEVTGDARWRQIVEAYWRCAVTDRGAFCTGGQTTGEVWTPRQVQATRLGDKNQEHCTVYNLMRLAEYLFRWTGDAGYADYLERNLYNGILAQQHPGTGQISYFLPLAPGSRKVWGSATNDFWCCHGTLVQAHTRHNAYIYYAGDEALYVAQYIPSELRWDRPAGPVTVRLTLDPESSLPSPSTPDGPAERPSRWTVELSVQSSQPTTFTLNLRLPEWLRTAAELSVNGERLPGAGGAPGFLALRRTWQRDVVRLHLPLSITACPLPDEPQTIAFLWGPLVLAGLCDEERTLVGDPTHPETMLAPENTRQWTEWLRGWRVVGQDRGLRFLPLHEVTGERYTLYFPVRVGG